MIEVQLDDGLQVSYRSGEDSAIEVVICHDNEPIATYETNSKPWDEGIVQVRNVIAMNLNGEYSRAELARMLNESVPAHESELRVVFE